MSQMAVPPGHLATYEVAIGADREALPISFDQARHVGHGDRDASWMALAMRWTDPLDRERLGAAWLKVIDRHSTLRSVFHQDELGGLHLRRVTVVPGRWVDHPDDAPIREALRTILDSTCRPFARPSHRLCTVAHDDDTTTVVIASDHSHVDMWSLAVLASDLVTYYDDLKASLPPARSFADHTQSLRERPPAPREVRDEWSRIITDGGGVMPRFPLPLGDISRKQAAVVEIRDVLDADETAVATQTARDQGVRLLALALSAMTAVTRELAQAPFRAVFPVHSRYDTSWFDAVGWFITNSVIESDDPNPVVCQDRVRASLALGTHSLADVLADFDGMPESAGMFALSWLDVGRMPVRVPGPMRAQYVSARIMTDGVMVWFIVNDDGLHLRARYPDNSTSRDSMTRWLDAVVERLRQICLPSMHG